MLKYWALIFIAIGLAILFVGSSIANVGASVDKLIASRWTGAALIAIGGVMFIGSDTKLKLELERAL